jgi:putative SbcD/Mre11-related phosphoesterase
MEIIDGIDIVDLALYVKKQGILVIADLHIGYEEALNKQGVFVPRFQFAELEKRLERILQRTRPKSIIVNGDIKHEFGEISDQEWRETLKILDLLLGYGPVKLTKGNHDTILGPIAQKRNVELKQSHIVGDILVVHGNKLIELPRNVKTIIIGHEHAALSLKENERVETYKCFLKGKFKGKNLIVMPSFNLVTEGTDVLRDELLSPYLKQDLRNFEVYVAGDNNILYFGKIKDLS